jgi:hypothetical protein
MIHHLNHRGRLKSSFEHEFTTLSDLYFILIDLKYSLTLNELYSSLSITACIIEADEPIMVFAGSQMLKEIEI